MRQSAFAVLMSGLSIGACTHEGPELAVDEGVAVSQVDTYAIVAAEVADLTREECGATFSLDDGNRAASGVYVVGVYPEPTRGQIVKKFPDTAVVLAFMDANSDLLEIAGHTLGTWCEGSGASDCKGAKTTTCYLDISRETTSLTDAARLARACNQKAVAWLAADGVKIVDQEGGKPFGDGKGLTGEALKPCVAARQH